MDSKSLLESLAEARMDTLYLERKAREAKDKVLADKLAARGADLKARIAALRGASHAEWAEGARGLSLRLKTARGRLKEALKKADQKQAWVRSGARTLAALDDVLASAGKILK